MSDWPAIACLCPTCGRFEQLRLALACFLAQDYPGEKRLLILNDAPEAIHTSHSSYPSDSVTVVNQTWRFANLGEKRNALLQASSTELAAMPSIAAHWDDDDLYLPWHLTRSVEALLREDRAAALRSPEGGVGCVKSRGGWYMTGSIQRPAAGDSRNRRGQPAAVAESRTLKAESPLRVRGPCHNVFEGTMVFRRQEALDLGGYPPRHSGQAKALLDAFERNDRLYRIPDDEGGGVSYVYRWADGLGHISGIGNKQDAAERFRRQNRDFGDGRPLTPGDLTPYFDAVGRAARAREASIRHSSLELRH